MNQENNTNNIGTLIKKLSPAFIFIGLFIIMSVASPAFTKFASLMNVLRQSAVVGILAIGQAMVIMSGGIDLSIGAMMALYSHAGNPDGGKRYCPCHYAGTACIQN